MEKKIFSINKNLKTKVPPIILASASPRRASILKQVGIKFTVKASKVKEIKWSSYQKQNQKKNLSPIKNSNHKFRLAKKMVLENAKLKGQHIANAERRSIIVAADTVVFCSDEVFEKPTNIANGKYMFEKYINNSAKVITAVHIIFPNATKTESKSASAIESTTLNTRNYLTSSNNYLFNLIFDKEKSGGFSIEGLGAIFFDNIRGSFYNVLGLPVHQVFELTSSAGYNIV